MLTLHVDAEIEKRLEALGATTESTKTALARQTLLEALEALGDLRTLRQDRPDGTTEDLKRVSREVTLSEDTLDAIESVVRDRAGSPARVVDLG